jgi:hypothetical protein
MAIDSRRRKVNAWRVGDRFFSTKASAVKHAGAGETPQRVLIVGNKGRIER